MDDRPRRSPLDKTSHKSLPIFVPRRVFLSACDRFGAPRVPSQAGHRRVLRPARHTRVCLRGRVLRRWPRLRSVARRASPNRSRMAPLAVFVASHLRACRSGSVSLPFVGGPSPGGFIPESRRLALSANTPPRQSCASWRSRRTESPPLAQLDARRRVPLLTSVRACGLLLPRPPLPASAEKEGEFDAGGGASVELSEANGEETSYSRRDASFSRRGIPQRRKAPRTDAEDGASSRTLERERDRAPTGRRVKTRPAENTTRGAMRGFFRGRSGADCAGARRIRQDCDPSRT